MRELALEKAIRYFGSTTSLAKKLGVHRSNIYAWRNNYSKIPLEHALQIDILTDGDITWKELVSKEIAHRLRSLSVSFQESISNPCVLVYLSIDRVQSVPSYHFSYEKELVDRPIGVDTQNNLIFGTRAWWHYHKLKKKTTPAWRISLLDILKDKINSRELHSVFLTSELAAIGIALERFLKDLRSQSKNNNEKPSSIFPDKGIRTREYITKKLGFSSHFVYEKAKKIYLNGHHLLIKDTDEKKLSISTASLISALPLIQQKKLLGKTRTEILDVTCKLKMNLGKKPIL